MKNRFKSLSKVKKALLFLIGSFILLFSAILLYYVSREEEKPKDLEKPKEAVIVKDNYNYDNGSLIFLDDKEESIGNYECINKNADKCYVSFELSEDAFDEEQNFYTDNKLVEKRTKIYFNRFAFITDGDKEFLYDFTLKKEIGSYGAKSFYSNYVTATENNYVILKNEENKYGVVDLDNKTMIEIIPFEYDYLGVIKKNVSAKNNKLVYQKDGKWGIISFKNKVLFTIDEQITDYNDTYVKTITNTNSYNLYKYDKTKVLENYSYIDTLTDLIVTIVDNKYIVVNNNELVPLYTEQIPIKNYNYVKKNIYDKDKNLIEVAKSYEITLVNETLYVNVINREDKTEYVFNILEGQMSYKNDFYSYSNGKLYFYGDNAKTELIGTYSCNNKNNLTASATSFGNCYLATDLTDTTKNYVIPIYQNRFVVVYDAPSLVNDSTIKYYLYDLQENKLMGRYLSIYAYAKESDTKGGVYHESEIPKYLVAVNGEKKYGVLKIDEEKASIAVSFLYDDIKKQGSYLLGKTSNNWKLLDYNGKEILDNAYQLYELYDEYIVAVDSENKLFIFNYNKKQIINEPVTINNINEKITLSLIGSNLVINADNTSYRYDLETGSKIGE